MELQRQRCGPGLDFGCQKSVRVPSTDFGKLEYSTNAMALKSANLVTTRRMLITCIEISRCTKSGGSPQSITPYMMKSDDLVLHKLLKSSYLTDHDYSLYCKNLTKTLQWRPRNIRKNFRRPSLKDRVLNPSVRAQSTETTEIPANQLWNIPYRAALPVILCFRRRKSCITSDVLRFTLYPLRHDTFENREHVSKTTRVEFIMISMRWYDERDSVPTNEQKCVERSWLFSSSSIKI